MSSEGTYFNESYQTYYSVLSNGGASKMANSYRENASFFNQQYDSSLQIISSWSGESAFSFNSSTITTFTDAFSLCKKNIDDSVEPVCKALEELEEKLEMVKTNEKNLLDLENELLSLNSNVPPETIPRLVPKDRNNGDLHVRETAHEYIYIKNPDYVLWKQKVDDLTLKIDDLVILLTKLKEECDNLIKTIEKFEKLIEEFTIQITTISSVSNDYNTENMSGKEKEQFLLELVDILTQKYNEIKSTYLSINSEEYNNVNLILAAAGVYDQLGYTYGSTMTTGANGNMIYMNPESLFYVLNYLTEKDFFTAFDSYMNGNSWKESGMDKVVFGGVNEESFWLFVNGTDSVTAKAAFIDSGAFEKYQSGVERLKEIQENYEENANELVSLGNSIHNFKVLASIMKYCGIENNPDYAENLTLSYDSFCLSIVGSYMDLENGDYVSYNGKDYRISTTEDGFFVLISLDGKETVRYEDINFSNQMLLYDEDFINSENRDVTILYENASIKERETYAYLLNTRGKEYAEQYLLDMQDVIFERSGEQRAYKFVEWIADNPHASEDEIKNFIGTCFDVTADHVNTFLKGSVDGLGNYFDGWVDLFNPSGTLEIKDYEKKYLLYYLTNSESPFREQLGLVKGKTLNVALNTGNSIGEKIVPTLAKTIGAPSFLVDVVNYAPKIGNKTESNFQYLKTANSEMAMSDMLFNSYLNAATTTLSKDALKSISPVFFDSDTTWGEIGMNTFNTVSPDYINSFFDATLLGKDIDAGKLYTNTVYSTLKNIVTSDSLATFDDPNSIDMIGSSWGGISSEKRGTTFDWLKTGAEAIGVDRDLVNPLNLVHVSSAHAETMADATQNSSVQNNNNNGLSLSLAPVEKKVESTFSDLVMDLISGKK